MIQRFTSRCLEALGNLYGIIGGQNKVDQIDMAPLVLVHDVSREAELNQNLPAGVDRGFFSYIETQDHVASGQVNDDQDVNALVQLIAGPGAQNTHRLWVLKISHWADIQPGNTADLSMIGIHTPVITGTYADFAYMLQMATAFGTTAFPSPARVPPTALITYNDLPAYCPPGSFIRTSSVVTIAAGTQQVRQDFLVWCGPIGTRPPGIS